MTATLKAGGKDLGALSGVYIAGQDYLCLSLNPDAAKGDRQDDEQRDVHPDPPRAALTGSRSISSARGTGPVPGLSGIEQLGRA